MTTPSDQSFSPERSRLVTLRDTDPRLVGHLGAVGPLRSERHYRRLLVYSVLLISAVAVTPLVIMTGVNFHQYQQAIHEESIRPVSRLTDNFKLALESFLSQRVSALSLVVRERAAEDLKDPVKLKRILRSVKQAFGGFIDLGIIEDDGRQVAYAGPYELEGKDYQDHGWFHEVNLRGVHISDVFMGHRNLPHFIIAVTHETDSEETLTLRATIDSEAINRQILSLGGQSSGDAFLVNRQGVLQTPSRLYGNVLQRLPFEMPPYSPSGEVIETQDAEGEPLIVGYAYVDRSPFTVMLLSHVGTMQEGWISLRRDLILFLTVSIILIVVVVLWGSAYMVNRQRDSDSKRAAIFHNLEYTNKMAAIGRLAAGVAHEINNPLAIINEKAGLLKDHLSLSERPPPPEKLLRQVNSVLKSVERCGVITHRLLGFAKHMEIQAEQISLDLLIKEVLGFLEKEAAYQNITIDVHVEEDPPTIYSDRGQLQQVFLNIINNAIAAVGDGGRIDITVAQRGNAQVAVSIRDNGPGISQENIQRIFEPFFTTKRTSGTGLGLSITYGIVQKLGGTISVESGLGEGACFTVALPVKKAYE